MFPIDEWAERHILESQKRGEFEHLPGAGKPLQLDDNSAVPVELRSIYHLMKNAGFMPAELLDCKEALKVADLLYATDPESKEYIELSGKLRSLELRLQLSGISTDFLNGTYQGAFKHKIDKSDDSGEV
ncbi:MULTISPECIES: DnaJ family domain-containing protein [Dickeya]|uniref:FIG004614: Putative cytoplasmic protein n=1 Tax=Dickeya aquatica TaxID=1401087 RepID=A0A375AFC0_9GAMM|nr:MULTISPECIES: DUF1992 domain-containing protein [Dickeya]SLM64794.1 FIG004614: Putative cytoplasmic protein [Dickeya aquatica]